MKIILLCVNLLYVQKLARNVLYTDVKFAIPEQILWLSNIHYYDK